MKYLKKIFESNKSDTIIDIESIFCEYLDDQHPGSDGQFYSDCYLEEDYSDAYVMVEISSSANDDVADDISTFDHIFKEEEASLNLMKSLRVCLVRLTHLGYKWEYSSSDDGYHIKVFYKDIDITLSKCVKGKSIEDSMFRELVKNKYDMDYLKYVYREGPPNIYNRSKGSMFVRFSKQVPEDSQLIKDLKDLKDDKGYKVFSSVVIDNNYSNNLDVIKLVPSY